MSGQLQQTNLGLTIGGLNNCRISCKVVHDWSLEVSPKSFSHEFIHEVIQSCVQRNVSKPKII